MAQWEYLTVELRQGTVEVPREPNRRGVVKVDTVTGWLAEPFTEQLNVYGQEGWELVTIFQEHDNLIGGSGGSLLKIFATFKRVLGG